jgi:hypothetical protein
MTSEETHVKKSRHSPLMMLKGSSMPWKGWTYHIMIVWNPFGVRGLIVAAYSSFKQRTKTFFNIT